MRPVLEHRWDLTPTEAVALQRQLAARVERQNRLPRLTTVCGLDVSYDRDDDVFFAAAVVLALPDLTVLESQTAAARSPFPYIPGLLSFREIPVAARALARLTIRPDLLACDGQGLAHPRRFGLACHLGVLYDVPALGLAKSRLIGEAAEPGPEKGAWTWLADRGENIGQIVRTRAGVAPLYVSPGHRLDFERARDIALALCPRWRLPETTRRAHRLVNDRRRAARLQDRSAIE